MPFNCKLALTPILATAVFALAHISPANAQTAEELLEQLKEHQQLQMEQQQELLNSMKTTTLLNCGITRENSRSVYGTESAGDMAVYNSDCGNERKFGYEEKQTIVLRLNGANIVSKIGNAHYGCDDDDEDSAKDASSIIWNPNSNYILVHRPNKNLTEAVAIPSDVGLGCHQITKNATPYNRFREIK